MLGVDWIAATSVALGVGAMGLLLALFASIGKAAEEQPQHRQPSHVKVADRTRLYDQDAEQ